MPRVSAWNSGMPSTGRIDAGQQRRRIVAEQIAGRNAAVLEGHLAAAAMLPGFVVRAHAQPWRIRRHQQHLRARLPRYLDQDRKQRGDRRVGDVVLGAVDDPFAVGGLDGGRFDHGVGRRRTMIVDAQAACRFRLHDPRRRDESDRRRRTSAGSARAGRRSSRDRTEDDRAMRSSPEWRRCRHRRPPVPRSRCSR